MHKLLERQLRRFCGETAVPEALRPLLDAVDQAYVQADVDRALLERSLELTAQELIARNCALRLDNAERQQLERRLHLADRMASMGTLAAGVAHEINNPLSCVVGNLQLLSAVATQGGEPGAALGRDEIADALAEASDAAERIRMVVRDLRSLSRPDDAAPGAVAIPPVLEAALSIARNQIRHRAQVTTDYGPAPRVDAHEPRLGQVFINLLVNAAQSMDEGAAEQNQIRVSTRTSAAGDAVIEIADTGSGMAPDVLRRIFDPFFTTKPVGFGTGLGLSICHGIVQSLGGDIAVESEPGRGTVFRVTLPATKLAVRAAVAPAVVATGARGRVLVVDDESIVANTLRRALASEHEVTVAQSGREALAALEAQAPFDVILCDLMMPEITGMELYERVQRGFPEQASRMIFLTGGAFTPSATAFLDTVPNTRFDKPFDIKSLRILIRGRIGELREAAAAASGGAREG